MKNASLTPRNDDTWIFEINHSSRQGTENGSAHAERTVLVNVSLETSFTSGRPEKQELGHFEAGQGGLESQHSCLSVCLLFVPVS